MAEMMSFDSRNLTKDGGVQAALELHKPGDKLQEMRVIRNLLSRLLGHKQSDAERRELLEETLWLFFCPFKAVPQQGVHILQILWLNDQTPIRVY
jgi:hypothetical protein